MCYLDVIRSVPAVIFAKRYRPDVGLLTSEPAKHDDELNPRIIAPDPLASDDCLDVFSSDHQLLLTTIEDENTMNTSEDEPSPGLNGRLRPRRSTVTSPHTNKAIRKPEPKTSLDRQKRPSTSSKTPSNKPDDLAQKSDSTNASQFLCPYCDRKFASKQTASQHARRVHLAPKQDALIGCLFCNHAELDSNGVIRHMVDSHPNQYFACLDCHTRFSSTPELAEHKLNVCEKQKIPYRSKLRQKVSSGAKKSQKSLKLEEKDFRSLDVKDLSEGHRFNGVVISCELKPSQVCDEADIEDNITTNLILPPSKNIGPNSAIEKNAVIVLDDIQWNKRMPTNFSFHNTDADQILSRLGVVHRSPRTGETTKKEWFKSGEEATQKFEKCFDTSFYSKVASNVHENMSKFLDGSFNFNPDPDSIIKTRKSKNSVVINAAEGFPILLACEQYSRNVLDGYMPRALAPKHKWKWENEKAPMNPDDIKHDTHVNNCIITLVSSLDIWTQLCMRRKFEEKFSIAPLEKKTEKQNTISKELKEILESRELPSSSQQVVKFVNKPMPSGDSLDFPASLGLKPSTPSYDVQPAVLSGEWVRPRCYVCCACGAQTRDSRSLSTHISTQHPNAQVQHYEIVGELLLNADILKHLYVPPSQMSNRTRPLRGFRECTKCKKSISLEDLHQHMLDCAGDTPAVRRKVRYRPFGVRRRRTRLPDNTIRKKIRKDIRTRQTRQKTHMRPRPKIRTEVGDAETIRKMLADLPAKRHRVMVNPMNPILRPRRKLDKQRNKIIMKRRSSDLLKNHKLRNIKGNNLSRTGSNSGDNDDNDSKSLQKSDDENKPLKPKVKQKVKTLKIRHSTRQTEALKRKVALNRAKRRTQIKEQKAAEEKPEQPVDTAASPSGGQVEQLSIDNSPQRIDVSCSPYNTREHSSRGRSNNREDPRPGPSSQDGNTNNSYAPPQNVPLKHSIARLTADADIHDKSLQYHHLYMMPSECNEVPQHTGPTGQQRLFENEAVVTKLDKPPLHFNVSGSADPFACHKSKQCNTSNNKRKGLNDCIAMLKNKAQTADTPDPPPKNSEDCTSNEMVMPYQQRSPNIEFQVNVNYDSNTRPAEIFSRHQLIPERFMDYNSESNLIAQNFAELPFHYLPTQRLSFDLPQPDTRIDPRFIKPPKKQNDGTPKTTRRRSTRAEKEQMKRQQEYMSRTSTVPYPVSMSAPSKVTATQARRASTQSVSVSTNTMVNKRRSSGSYNQSRTNQVEGMISSQRPLEYHPHRISPDTRLMDLNPSEVYMEAQKNLQKQMIACAENYMNKKQLALCVDTNYTNKKSNTLSPEALYLSSKQATSPGSSFMNSMQAISPGSGYINSTQTTSPGSSVINSKQATSPGSSCTNGKPALSPGSGYMNSKQTTSPESNYTSKKQAAVGSDGSHSNKQKQQPSPVESNYLKKNLITKTKETYLHKNLSVCTDTAYKQPYPTTALDSDLMPKPSQPAMYVESAYVNKKSQAATAEKNSSNKAPVAASNESYANKSHGKKTDSNLQSQMLPMTEGNFISTAAQVSDSNFATKIQSVATETNFTPRTSPVTPGETAFISKKQAAISENTFVNKKQLAASHESTYISKIQAAASEMTFINKNQAATSDAVYVNKKQAVALENSLNKKSITSTESSVSNKKLISGPEKNIMDNSQSTPAAEPNTSGKKVLEVISEIYPESAFINLPANIPPTYPTLSAGFATGPNEIEAPLDLSKTTLMETPIMSEKDASTYGSEGYESYETLDLSQKCSEDNEINDVVDLRVKVTSPEPIADLTSKLPSSDDMDSATDLSLKNRDNDAPTDLTVKKKTNKDTYEYDVRNVNYDDAQDFIQDLRKPHADELPIALTSNVRDPNTPTDLSGRSRDLPLDMAATKAISLQTHSDSIVERSEMFKPADLSVRDQTKQIIPGASVHSSISVSNTPPKKISKESYISPKIINESPYAAKAHYDANMHKQSYGPSTPLCTSIPHVGETTATDRSSISVASSNLLPEKKQQVDRTAYDNVSRLVVTDVSTNSVASIPLVTASNTVVTMQTSKYESTTPVYTLANACISMAKIETPSAVPLSEAITSFPNKNISSAAPVYTLTDTSVNPRLNVHNQSSREVLSATINSICNTHISTGNFTSMSSNLSLAKPDDEHNKQRYTQSGDVDSETAKKIAMLPKELVEILGTMPVDHRNQLLNVLPQYVSTPGAQTESSDSAVANTSIANRIGSPPKVLDSDVKPSLGHSPVSSSQLTCLTALTQPVTAFVPCTDMIDVAKSFPHHLTGLSSLDPENNAPLPRMYEVDGNTVIDLTEDDPTNVDIKKNIIEPNNADTMSATDLGRIAANNKLNKPKVSDQTASLRAVRIKAPSERNKSLSLDTNTVSKTTSQEQQIKSNIQYIQDLDTDVDKTTDFDKTLAIQQAEISSTQHNTTIAGHGKYPLAISPSSTEYSGDESSKHATRPSPIPAADKMAKNIEEKKCETTTPKTGMVTSSISTNSNVDNNLNNIIDTIVPALLKPREAANNDSILISENKKSDSPMHTEYEDDSEDDMSLAAIIKQKLGNKVKITENNVAKEKSNEQPNKKKSKKVKKVTAKKVRDYTQEDISLKEQDDVPILKRANSPNGNELDDSHNDGSEQAATPEQDIEINKNAKKRPKKGRRPIDISNTLNKESDEVQNIEGDKEINKENDMISKFINNKDVSEYSIPVDVKSNIKDSSPRSHDVVDSRDNPSEATKIKTMLRVNKGSPTEKDIIVRVRKLSDDISTSFITKEKRKPRGKKKRLEFSESNISHEITDKEVEEKSSSGESELSQIDLNTENILTSIDEPDYAKYKRTTRSTKLKNEDIEKIAQEVGVTFDIKENITTPIPLRRSRRGKSLFVESTPIENETLECITEQNTHLTKKQLILSKLRQTEEGTPKSLSKLRQTEEGTPKSSAHTTPEKQSPHLNKPGNDYGESIDTLEISNIEEPCETYTKKRKNVKGTKRRNSTHFTKKPKKKKSVPAQNKINEECHTSDLENIQDSSENLTSVQSNVKNRLSESSNEFNDESNDSPVLSTYINNSEKNISKEKRKINNQISFDLSQSSKPKKSKLSKSNAQDVEFSDEYSRNDSSEDTVVNIVPETKTACYNVQIPARRARSKSAVVKSGTEKYDPYDINLEVMTEENEEVESQQSVVKNSKRKVGNTSAKESNKSKSDLRPNNRSYLTRQDKKAASRRDDEIIDSDDSTSDVPLQQYIDQKVKKNILLETTKEKKSKGEIKATRSSERCRRRSSATEKTVDVTPTESEEELRSEQFMESFGFFSEKKPRKCNILATKKISDTINITNESDARYFGFRKGERSSKRNSYDSKKSSENNITKTVQPSTAKKAPAKRGRKKKVVVVENVVVEKVVEVKKMMVVPRYCELCKKEFRRPDNYIRHTFSSLLHVSKVSEAELKVKTLPVQDDPNFLIAYKNHLERFTTLLDRLAALKKTNAKAAAKIPLPTHNEILGDVNKSIVELQVTTRHLSRDEALFLDCCELLKGANKHRNGSAIDLFESALDEEEAKLRECPDDDVDSITAKNILESEEVRNLENDLISGFKEAANSKLRQANNFALSQVAASQVEISQVVIPQVTMSHEVLPEIGTSQETRAEDAMQGGAISHVEMQQEGLKQHGEMIQRQVPHMEIQQMPMVHSEIQQVAIAHTEMQHAAMVHTEMHQTAMTHTEFHQAAIAHTAMPQVAIAHTEIQQAAIAHTEMYQATAQTEIHQAAMAHMEMHQSEMTRMEMHQAAMARREMHQAAMAHMEMHHAAMDHTEMHQAALAHREMQQSAMAHIEMQQAATPNITMPDADMQQVTQSHTQMQQMALQNVRMQHVALPHAQIQQTEMQQAAITQVTLMRQDHTIQDEDDVVFQEDEFLEDDDIVQEDDILQDDEILQDDDMHVDDTVQEDDILQDHEIVQDDDILHDDDTVQEDDILQDDEILQEDDILQDDENMQEDVVVQEDNVLHTESAQEETCDLDLSQDLREEVDVQESHDRKSKETNDEFSSPLGTDSHCDNIEDSDVPVKSKASKAKKHIEVKEKMYPDIIIEDIDMFEDKFDKIKRKCRSQAAAAKQPQPIIERTTSNKGRKKSEKKKGKKGSKKAAVHQNTQVPTKGALKGFDGIKVSIPTSDINLSSIVPAYESSSKKKKKSGSKKKRERKDSESSIEVSDHHHQVCNDDHESSDSKDDEDVYEFKENEPEVFDFRASTIMERFKSINNRDMPSTSRVSTVAEDDFSSDSASDGDDFVYMSDDYVCSDDETENSLMSCETSNGKIGNDVKKNTPQKRKDAVEKNAVMGKIFKHNAVRTEKKPPAIKEPAKPKANMDQLFDSLLEEEPNSSILNSEALSPKDDDNPKTKYSQPSAIPCDQTSIDEETVESLQDIPYCSSPDISDSPLTAPLSQRRNSNHNKKRDKKSNLSDINYGSSTSKKYDTSVADNGPSNSKRYDKTLAKDYKDVPFKCYDSKKYEDNYKHHESKTKKRHNSTSSNNDDDAFRPYDEEVKSPASKPDEGISTSYDYNTETYDQSMVEEDTGVARQRARRKCTVGKQNVLTESWSSESDQDGMPPRPNSAESVLSCIVRKKKGKKKEGHQASGKRGNGRQAGHKKQDIESRVGNSRLTSGPAGSGASVGRRRVSAGDSPSGASVEAAEMHPSMSEKAAAAVMPAPSTSHAVAGPSGVKGRRSFWASEQDEEQERHQQHGWIVGDSHKKLVTMLAHAKGRKRNDDKRHLVE